MVVFAVHSSAANYNQHCSALIAWRAHKFPLGVSNPGIRPSCFETASQSDVEELLWRNNCGFLNLRWEAICWISYLFEFLLTVIRDWTEQRMQRFILRFLGLSFAFASYTLPCLSQLACIEDQFFFLFYMYMICSELASAGIKELLLCECNSSDKYKAQVEQSMFHVWALIKVNYSSGSLGRLSAHVGCSWWGAGSWCVCVQVLLYPACFGTCSWMGL